MINLKKKLLELLEIKNAKDRVNSKLDKTEERLSEPKKWILGKSPEYSIKQLRKLKYKKRTYDLKNRTWRSKVSVLWVLEGEIREKEGEAIFRDED